MPKIFQIAEIHTLISQIQKQPSQKNIAKFIRLFRLLVKVDEESNAEQEEDQQQKKSDFIIEDPEVYEKVLKFGFERFPTIFKEYLDFQNPKTLKLKSKKQEILLKVYVYNVYKFVHQIQQDDMNLFVLKHLGEISDLFYPFSQLLNKLISHIVDIWAGSDNYIIKLHSFIVLQRMVKTLEDKDLQEKIFRKMYLHYTKNVKVVTWRNYELILFMNNCFCEILGNNFDIAYLVSFSYIRQLAVHLKTQIKDKKEGSELFIYNWQNINCLRLWVLAVTRYSSKDQLGQLIHPLIEIIQGMITYQDKQAAFIPSHLHLVRLLILISQKTNVFVPTWKYM